MWSPHTTPHPVEVDNFEWLDRSVLPASTRLEPDIHSHTCLQVNESRREAGPRRTGGRERLCYAALGAHSIVECGNADAVPSVLPCHSWGTPARTARSVSSRCSSPRSVSSRSDSSRLLSSRSLSTRTPQGWGSLSPLAKRLSAWHRFSRSEGILSLLVSRSVNMQLTAGSAIGE